MTWYLLNEYDNGVLRVHAVIARETGNSGGVWDVQFTSLNGGAKYAERNSLEPRFMNSTTYVYVPRFIERAVMITEQTAFAPRIGKVRYEDSFYRALRELKLDERVPSHWNNISDEETAGEAMEAFWRVVAEHSKRCPTGDLPPQLGESFDAMCTEAIRAWREYNDLVPRYKEAS